MTPETDVCAILKFFFLASDLFPNPTYVVNNYEMASKLWEQSVLEKKDFLR